MDFMVWERNRVGGGEKRHGKSVIPVVAAEFHLERETSPGF